MERAYDLAAAAVLERLRQHCPERLETLRSIEAGDVLVYQGDFDNVEGLLTRLKVPFERRPTAGKLRKAQIVFANCSRSTNRTLAKNVEPFVRGGGWFVSSDWSLDNYVEPRFPNTVGWKDRKQTDHEVVAVEPACDSLWSDVAVPGADPQWWLWGSHPIEVLDADRVRVEAASHHLWKQFDAPAISVRFDWEQGHVFHIISHFWVKYTRTPQARYEGPCTEFLKAGLRLSDDSIERVMSRMRMAPSDLTFAEIQSAATSTELAAQLCIEAVGNHVPAVVA